MTPDIITKATMTAATATAPSISKAIYTVSSATTKTSTSTLSSLSMRTATTAISAATSTTTSSPSTTSIVQRHRLTIEKLRHRVHQILKCVINLHIDILVLESNVNQLLDEVKEFNADLMEVKRLDDLIETLRDYSGPTIYHEWPFPLVCHATIDEADLAQTLNTS
ncbi:intermembrane lipid transfer protein vps13F isoform X1 [Calliphora vicina]|uniref:intermembrane lipid transfer protein vps13F isoform X1 n=1 Tax=Calliphora vicina TaxID=7373 RepID=UPI00325C28D7